VVTVGAIESTFQLRVAGEASRLPAASVAATSKAWPPWPTEAWSLGELQADPHRGAGRAPSSCT
jgi:hypothetical protein